MVPNKQTPEREINLISFDLYLQEFPTTAHDLAIDHYEKYLDLADDYKRLRMDFNDLQQENIKLKSLINHRSPSLPSFVNLNRGAS